MSQPGATFGAGAPPSSWSDIPISILHAELVRRKQQGERPECGSGNTTRGYNTLLHVGALFLILILSTAACSFPIIVRRFPKLPVPNYALFLSRHFGTGVLIATAFVHLFPTAYTNLTDPCLPPFWTETYPAMPGFIAMVSVLVVVGIEMFFAIKGAGHSHGVDFELLRGDDEERPPSLMRSRQSGTFNRYRHEPLSTNADEDEMPTSERASMHSARTDDTAILNKPLPSTPPYEDDSDLDLDELDPVMDDSRPLNGLNQDPTKPAQTNSSRRARHSRQVSFQSPEREVVEGGGSSHTELSEQRAILQCLLLEAGILFHSVFIGMAVSVSTGPAFVVLLIAISFHQTFEGLALGSRIAAIGSFSTSSLKPWLMSFMYGVTTPVGQAIGLAVHTLYDPASQFGLLMVGIVNAISTGLLLYAGLVQLLAEDFLTDKSYAELRGRKRLEACAAVIAGSMLMALVGAFA